MYADPAAAQSASRAFLDDQLRRHRTKPDLPYVMLDDGRRRDPCRISVIVSLYNAADKLPVFLRMLGQQTAIRSGEAELVLIDSGSCGNEHEIFRQLWNHQAWPAVFARSRERETIQAAWNRGIKLSQGEYLAFLGVDEGLHPEGLHLLARELDRNPSVDWAMADSIVTTVDRGGVFDHDVMPYDRDGYRHDWHYLDCTFLSYVGGLYRRRIHDRYGYYDETFRAAGDTEFKNRVLPFIKSKYVPRPLGVFNNYPDERMTQHPRAEIEDLRAWYLHRTPGGLSYGFDQRPSADVVELLKDALGYHKSYVPHVSTDVELARHLGWHLANREESPEWKKLAAALDRLLVLYRGLELLPDRGSAGSDRKSFIKDCWTVAGLRRELRTLLDLAEPPALDIFNDNRYEQHFWSWST
jgi:glycosyltransferase involved in cell wall biosynthesis